MSIGLVARRAALSRFIVVTACIASDILIPDHKPDDSVLFGPVGAPAWLAGFTRWDAARFLAIASGGYNNEESYAFFPALPLAVSAFATLLKSLGCSTGAAPVLAGILITNGSFVVATSALYCLGIAVCRNESVARRAALLFCCTPAGVFMSSIYTESPFAACTFGGLWLLELGHLNFATMLLTLATALRSNGVLNCGFIAFDAFVRILRGPLRQAVRPNVAGSACRVLCIVVFALLRCGLIVAPYIGMQRLAYLRECSACKAGACKNWCDSRIPNIYAHVQATSWQVGLLRYWQWRQLPNFLLAAPAAILAAASACQLIVKFSRQARRVPLDLLIEGLPLLPYVVHWGALTAFVVLFANVQVLTRLVAAGCPAFHWYLASRLPPDGISTYDRKLLWGYIALWNFLGVAMHPNFLPWT